MLRARGMRCLQWLATGMVLAQFGGCTFTQVNDAVQTILLGITAAGGIAIIRNI